MNPPLLWLHEEALSMTHPIFKTAPHGTKAVFIWDDDYFRQAHYSLKRLVFIYETLLELPIDILYGNTQSVIRECAPSALYIPATVNPSLKEIIRSLEEIACVHVVQDDPFVTLKKPMEFRRFFQYWNKAQKTAFLPNGGLTEGTRD